MNNPHLRSIQVGVPQQYGNAAAVEPFGQAWTSGIDKTPVSDAIWLGKTNLEGDRQADQINHGGPDKAVCVYSADHYPYWREALGRPDLAFGAFGENFTVDGLAESGTCIGDIWRVGEAIVQVSQPRQPCWKLARRWRVENIVMQIQGLGWTGWYVRVLHEGIVAAGQSLVLVERPHPAWTIERANRVMHHEKSDLAAARELADLPQLSASWQQSLARRGALGDRT